MLISSHRCEQPASGFQQPGLCPRPGTPLPPVKPRLALPALAAGSPSMPESILAPGRLLAITPGPGCPLRVLLLAGRCPEGWSTPGRLGVSLNQQSTPQRARRMLRLLINTMQQQQR